MQHHGFMGQLTPNYLIEAEIWRPKRISQAETREQIEAARWGEVEIEPEDAEAEVSALINYEHYKTITKCVFEPRTTGFETRTSPHDGTNRSKATLLISDIRTEIRSDDRIAFKDGGGRYQVWDIEGEPGTNSYVSPFSGLVGGREIHIERVTEVKNG